MQSDVEAIVQSKPGIPRSLAAFMVRYVGYRDGSATALSSGTLEEVMHCCTSSTSPSDATLRMQAAYTASYFKAHSALEASQRAQARKLEEVLAAMDALAAGGGPLPAPGGTAPTLSSSALLGAATPASVGALSDIHKLLLDFCATYAAMDAALGGRRPAPGSLSPTPPCGPLTLPEFASASSRESLAALESVFPMSSIPAFSALQPSARAAQAVAIARLALGVRLFNWSLGKGGLGLENTPARGLEEAVALEKELLGAMRGSMAACDGYMDVFATAAGGGGGREERILSALAASGAEEGAWAEELLNRRQMALLAVSLAGEVGSHTGVLQSAGGAARSAQDSLRALLRGAASAGAPKEAVYPHFEALAEAWLASADARAAVGCARAVWQGIAPFSPPSLCTLPEAVKQLAQAGLGLAGRQASAGSLPVAPPPAPAGGEGEGAVSHVPVAAIDPATATVECGGFCPVSLATPPPRLLPGGEEPSPSRFTGTLVHGDAALGYQSYAGRLYSCASQAAALAFAAAPAHYVAAASAAALRHPALVFPLQLYVPGRAGHFPELNLPLLARFDGDLGAVAQAVAGELAGGEGGAAAAAAAAPLPVPAAARTNKAGRAVADAGVETPTHFVARHVDPGYSFSEWALRRSALQMARLRQCATVSVQTAGSAFRRDNDSQVHAPVSVGVQSVSSVGVSTERPVAQVVRVRGARDAVVEAAMERKLQGLPAMPLPGEGGGGGRG